MHFEAPIAGRTPDEAWAALVDIGKWWNPEHTYSGSSDNLSLEPRAGGCFCERWAGGSGEHAVVLTAIPKAIMLRL